jgi:NYN domain
VSDVAAGVGRHAVLVDAGYLYASVGQLVLGRTSRREFRIAAEPLIGALLARADRTTPGELLRMYWYDAARDRVPTVDQRQIAALPHVKVRLGNLNSAGQQKGVDAQLRQDLEVLARHRAVTDVVLIAGDEDMVPAVEAAQAYGVRVHVWGVEPPYGVNQAERLVWEADTVDQLDADFCRPYVEIEPGAVESGLVESGPVGSGPIGSGPVVSGPGVPAPAESAVEPGSRDDKPAVPTPADVFAARKLAGPPPARPVAVGPAPGPGPSAAPERPGPERPEMEQIGARIAARWLLTRGRENVADLLPGPVLPTVIDKELLVEAEEEISRSLRPYEEARRALRDGFWAKLHQEFGIQPASVPPYPTPDHATPAQATPAQATPAQATPADPGPAHPAPAGATAQPDPPHSGPANPGPAHSAPAQPATAPHPGSANGGADHSRPPQLAPAPHPGPASSAAHSGPVHPTPAQPPGAVHGGPAHSGAHPGPASGYPTPGQSDGTGPAADGSARPGGPKAPQPSAPHPTPAPS